jgi:hypothetical protein
VSTRHSRQAFSVPSNQTPGSTPKGDPSLIAFTSVSSTISTRSSSLRRERVAAVRRCLRNYQKLKEAIEVICELNHELLRPERAPSKRRSKPRD